MDRWIYYYLTILIFQYFVGICAQYQHSFHADDKIMEQSTFMNLKNIYHHASPNATPKLFRRYDVQTIQQKQQQKQKDTNTYQVASVVGEYERLGKHAKNYLIQQSKSQNDIMTSLQGYQPTKIRWNHLASLTASNLDILKESNQGTIPKVTDRTTILSLAMMTNNAYNDADNATDWYDLGDTWHRNESFGWQSDGVRGHVFGNQDDSLFIISFKGTSVGLWKDGPTGEKDKINDNMLFSCCCARISRAWTPVCDCYQENEYICKSDCLEKNILNTEFYYDHAMAIYLDVADRYPDASIWLTGHSLGGSLASLVGQTFGIPAISFEAPGEQLASFRLHLPYYKNMPLWHFGHTADPIFTGECSGASSSCWYGGFAMESKCHKGKMCVWDTVKDYNWRVDARTHRIRSLIDEILNKTEDEFPLPTCKKEMDCMDCGPWSFIDIRDGTTTLSTATATQNPA